MVRIRGIAVLVLLLATPALARTPWPRVAHGQDGPCGMQVSGNGKFFRIEVRGLSPGERASFHLTNADMTPIRSTLVADRNGKWAKYYLPFLWHHRSGEVTVRVVTEECRLDASFPWTRDLAY